MSRTILILTLTVSFVLLNAQTSNAQQIDPTWADINYAGNDGNVRHNLDIYLPDSGKGLFPVIVYIHGGGWQNGNKNNVDPVVPIVEKGYALVSINYRLSGEAVYPGQINDCKAAIRWIRAHADTYNLNASRIGVIGSSAGAHLGALLGTSGEVSSHTVGNVTMDIEGNVGGNSEFSSRVQAVSDWYGPTDFLKMSDFPGNIDHDAPDSPESKLIGGAIQENPDKCALADPITFASHDDAPLLIIHGTADMTVPYNQSELLYQALEPLFDSTGTEITLFPVDGAGHGFGSTMNEETFTMMADFFDRTINPSTAIKNAALLKKAPVILLKYYVNPINACINILYKQLSSGYIRVEMYNTAGKRCAILMDANMHAGIYTITWNPTTFSPGTYFCKLITDSYERAHKVLLSK